MIPTDNNLESEFTFENAAVPMPEEPPFYILMLGDWSGDSDKKALTDRKPVVIDRDNFDEVLKRLNVRLELDWQGSGTERLSLEFTELDDFHPDNLFRNVSLFADLRDIRRRLSDPETFNRAANEVRSWFSGNEDKSGSQTEDAPIVETDNLLDLILTTPNDSAAVKPRMVDNSDLGRFVSKIVSPHLIQIDENEQKSLISAVDETISELMRAILHHPKFQTLESAWRGLYFLVRRLETDVDLKIFISNATKQELSDNFKSVESLADSFLYRQLTVGSLGNFAEDSFALIGGDYSFELNVDDVAALMRIGKISSSLNAPFISQLKPNIFGIDDFSKLSDSTGLKALNGSNEEKLWNALRSTPEAGGIGLSPMRVLARLPYGSVTESTENFSFEEFTNTPLHQNYLWMNPCFVSILLLAQSYRRFGWEMAGNFINEVNNLPLHFFQDDGETKSKPCAEVGLTESSLEQILEQGFIPLVSYRDTDKIRIARFQSISNSNPGLTGKW